jgi:alpha-methylacyl-CoA racemase
LDDEWAAFKRHNESFFKSAHNAMTNASASPSSHGPLARIRVIEFAGIGPGPFAGMMLADMGAEVIVIERPDNARPGMPRVAMNRGKRSIVLDLKTEAGRATAWRLLETADAMIEGFRPGVMERLGFGPDAVSARNPRLIYGRMTGWGQTGPLAQAAGHDINYVALTGILDISVRPGQLPVVPPTIVGDMAGGAMFLAFGIVCALLEARQSGKGQVIDAAIVDGVAALSGLVHALRGVGFWRDDPERNFFLNTSPYYEVFECSDGHAITLGAIEPQFYAELLQRLGLTDVDPMHQNDSSAWPALKARVAALIKTRSRDEWRQLLEGTDACFAPVLSLEEAPRHPHNAARGIFVDVEGKQQPAPAPRLSRTPARPPSAGTHAGEHTDEILGELARRTPG